MDRDNSLSPVKDGPDMFTLQVGLGSFSFLRLWTACGYLPQPVYHIRYTGLSLSRSLGK
jgi:hypothetical protein